MSRSLRAAFELAVVGVIVGFLCLVLMARLRLLQADAEAAHVRHVLAHLRSGLAYETAGWLARGSPEDELERLLGSDPMALLAFAPSAYQGTLEPAAAARTPPGVWYFDAQERALVYRVRRAEAFESALPPPARIRFKITSIVDDSSSSGSTSPPGRTLRGLRLVALEPYAFTHRRDD